MLTGVVAVLLLPRAGFPFMWTDLLFGTYTGTYLGKCEMRDAAEAIAECRRGDRRVWPGY
jgi:hypothetical protein